MQFLPKNRYHSNLEEFAETSGISGVLYAYHGRKLTEKVFWIVLIMIALALTVKDLAFLVLQYNSEQTVTDIMVFENTSIRLPDPVICFRMRASNMMSTIRGMHWSILDPAVVNSTLAYFNRISDVAAWMEEHATDTTLTDSHAALLILATNLFLGLSYVENAFVSSTMVKTPSSINATYSSFIDRSIADQLGVSLIQCRNFFIAHNVDMIKLRNTLVTTWVSQVQMQFIKSTEEDGNFISKTNQVEAVWFGFEPFTFGYYMNICFRVVDVAPYFTFYADEGKWFWTSYKQLSFADYKNQSFTGIPSLDVVLSTDRTALQASWTKKVISWRASYDNILITYESRHRAADLRRLPCSVSTTLFDCKLSCQAKFLVDNCKCYPSSWLWPGVLPKQPDMPICGLSTKDTPRKLEISEFQMCINRLSENFNALKRCSTNCVRDCETISFTFQSVNWDGATGWLALMLSQFRYTELRERLSMSSNDFIGNVGGILGVWTGASVLAYLHVVISVTKWTMLKWKVWKGSSMMRPRVSSESCRKVIDLENGVVRPTDTNADLKLPPSKATERYKPTVVSHNAIYCTDDT